MYKEEEELCLIWIIIREVFTKVRSLFSCCCLSVYSILIWAQMFVPDYRLPPSSLLPSCTQCLVLILWSFFDCLSGYRDLWKLAMTQTSSGMLSDHQQTDSPCWYYVLLVYRQKSILWRLQYFVNKKRKSSHKLKDWHSSCQACRLLAGQACRQVDEQIRQIPWWSFMMRFRRNEIEISDSYLTPVSLKIEKNAQAWVTVLQDLKTHSPQCHNFARIIALARVREK